LEKWSAIQADPARRRDYVFDNNCTDKTAEIARAARRASCAARNGQGKGYVVASMFEQVEADIYIKWWTVTPLIDASSVQLLLEPILKGDADITVATRSRNSRINHFGICHILGNRMVCGIINGCSNRDSNDIFSGYRALYPVEAAKLIPVTAPRFDVETELTLRRSIARLVIKEVEAPYGNRPQGSVSKIEDRVGRYVSFCLKLFLMIRSYKPLTFFCRVGHFLISGGDGSRGHLAW